MKMEFNPLSFANHAPFTYRRSSQAEVAVYLGWTAEAWTRYWVVVDREGRPCAFKKSEKVAQQTVEAYNLKAAKEIIGGGNPPKVD